MGLDDAAQRVPQVMAAPLCSSTEKAAIAAATRHGMADSPKPAARPRLAWPRFAMRVWVFSILQLQFQYS